MYVYCLFCHAHLSSNQTIENFPVGRRLAFDAAKGRLWVVCRHCDGWNLTPLEERWEAIEECEKLFRVTRTRVSTGEIGLARTRSGMDLIRVGEPLLPELASWRYKGHFARRMLRPVWRVVGHGLVIAGTAGAAGIGFGLAAIAGGASVIHMRRVLRRERIIAMVPTGSRSTHKFIEVRAKHLKDAKLVRTEDNKGVAVHIPSEQGVFTIENDRAISALQYVMPDINSRGTTPWGVRAAVEALEHAGEAHRMLKIASSKEKFSEAAPLRDLNPAFRYAIEMAVNEENERAAMQGEMDALVHAWKDAERIASIADNMFVPEWMEEFIARNRTNPAPHKA